MNRRPNYPDLLGQPSPALLRLDTSKSLEEVDKFIKGWKTELDVLMTKDRTGEQDRLVERLNALILRGKSKRRQLKQRSR